MAAWQSTDDALEYAAGILRGERVELRAVRESDLACFAEWWNDPKLGLLQSMLALPVPQANQIERFREWSANKDRSSAAFSVVRRADQTLLGQVALTEINVLPRNATFAIMIAPEFQGAGYGTDTTRTALRWGFGELDLHRIGLSTFSFNTRAIAAYQRAGFTEEGRRREVIPHDGHRYDEVIMGILRREWEGTQR